MDALDNDCIDIQIKWRALQIWNVNDHDFSICKKFFNTPPGLGHDVIES